MQKKVKFRTQYNYKFGESPTDQCYNGLPSMTVPDESLTVRQLFDRFSKNLPLGVSGYTPIYDGDDPDFDDYDVTRNGDFDMVDAMEERASIRASYEAKQAQQRKQLDEAKRKKEAEAVQPDPSEAVDETADAP